MSCVLRPALDLGLKLLQLTGIRGLQCQLLWDLIGILCLCLHWRLQVGGWLEGSADGARTCTAHADREKYLLSTLAGIYQQWRIDRPWGRDAVAFHSSLKCCATWQRLTIHTWKPFIKSFLAQCIMARQCECAVHCDLQAGLWHHSSEFMSNVQTILLIYIWYFHFPALDAGQHVIQRSQRATQAPALKWGMLQLLNQTMGAWIASRTSTGTIGC